MTSSTPDWLVQHEEHLDNGSIVLVNYDQEGDILELFFADGEGIAIELAEEIVLRYDETRGTPLSLIIFSPGQLLQPTEYGPESVRLNGLEQLPRERRHAVMQMLTSAPVNHYLYVSALHSPSDKRLVPIAYLRQALTASLQKHGEEIRTLSARKVPRVEAVQ